MWALLRIPVVLVNIFSRANSGSGNTELVNEPDTESATQAAPPQSQCSVEKVIIFLVFLVAAIAGLALIIKLSSGATATGYVKNGSGASASRWQKTLSPPPSFSVNNSLASLLADANGEKIKICNTKECVIAAAEILQSIDISVDPCQDFYSFSCGNWKKNHPLSSSITKATQFIDVAVKVQEQLLEILESPQVEEPSNAMFPNRLNQAKVFFKTCTNVTLGDRIGLKPLVDFLQKFGGWPVALNEDAWDEDSFDLAQTIIESKRQIGVGWIFKVDVFPDQRSPLNNALYIDQTTLGISRSILIDIENLDKSNLKYLSNMISKVNLIGNYLGTNLSKSKIFKEMLDVIEFESKLASLTEPASNRRDVNRMYNPMTVEKLQNHIGIKSQFNILEILNGMFSSTNINITSQTRIIVRELKYMQNVGRLIDKTPKRVLANYILWRQIFVLGRETTQQMRDSGSSIEYEGMTNALSEITTTWRFDCVASTNAFMGTALGVEYIRLNFHNDTKGVVDMMLEDLRSAFKNLLKTNDWMDEETLPLAIEKADYMSKFLAYPQWYDSNDLAVLLKLDQYYSGLSGISKESHFSNVLTFASYYSSRKLSELDKAVDEKRWASFPQEVNAFYNPQSNSITFPAGIMQPPFYRVHTPNYISYGALGQVIGHEITHGFDDKGRQYDKKGAESPWWRFKTIMAFKEKEYCIIDQYNSFLIPELNVPINGKNTQGENIADNGGLRQAYFAYLKFVERSGEEPRLPGLNQFTPLQMFFISNANIWCANRSKGQKAIQYLDDPHSYEKYRVNAPMGNMVEFSHIFNCPAGSPMNPWHKCVVW